MIVEEDMDLSREETSSKQSSPHTVEGIYLIYFAISNVLRVNAIENRREEIQKASSNFRSVSLGVLYKKEMERMEDIYISKKFVGLGYIVDLGSLTVIVYILEMFIIAYLAHKFRCIISSKMVIYVWRILEKY